HNAPHRPLLPPPLPLPATQHQPRRSQACSRVWSNPWSGYSLEKRKPLLRKSRRRLQPAVVRRVTMSAAAAVSRIAAAIRVSLAIKSVNRAKNVLLAQNASLAKNEPHARNVSRASAKSASLASRSKRMKPSLKPAASERPEKSVNLVKS